MKILILTHNNDRHYYLCNQIIKKSENTIGVITGCKSINRSGKEKIYYLLKNYYFLYFIKNKVINFIFNKIGMKLAKEKVLSEKKYFGGSEAYFKENYKHLLLTKVDKSDRSINDKRFISIIQSKSPDLIIVMGACLIGKKIISSAKNIINIHTGLSPYYRGSYTNLWPIINDDFGFFGVTIHLMSLGIDSGDIVFTSQPKIKLNDSYSDINSECIKIGASLVIDAIKLARTNKLYSTKQWEKGKLFLNKQMNFFIAYKYYKNKKKYMLKHYELEKTLNLPMVKLVSKGRIINV